MGFLELVKEAAILQRRLRIIRNRQKFPHNDRYQLLLVVGLYRSLDKHLEEDSVPDSGYINTAHCRFYFSKTIDSKKLNFEEIYSENIYLLSILFQSDSFVVEPKIKI